MSVNTTELTLAELLKHPGLPQVGAHKIETQLRDLNDLRRCGSDSIAALIRAWESLRRQPLRDPADTRELHRIVWSRVWALQELQSTAPRRPAFCDDRQMEDFPPDMEVKLYSEERWHDTFTESYDPFGDYLTVKIHGKFRLLKPYDYRLLPVRDLGEFRLHPDFFELWLQTVADNLRQPYEILLATSAR